MSRKMRRKSGSGRRLWRLIRFRLSLVSIHERTFSRHRRRWRYSNNSNGRSSNSHTSNNRSKPRKQLVLERRPRPQRPEHCRFQTSRWIPQVNTFKIDGICWR